MRQLGDKVYALMDQLRQHQAGGSLFLRYLVSVFEGRSSCRVIPTRFFEAPVFVATTFLIQLGGKADSQEHPQQCCGDHPRVI